jgi:3-hydroxybutyryl-CoA dehydrogenase
MGRGIATCLLANGFKVIGFDTDHRKLASSRIHIQNALSELHRRKLLSAKALKTWPANYCTSRSLRRAAECSIVIECVREDLELKRSLFAKLDQVVPATTIIASNTSSLPITQLQKERVNPERYIGMHWGEPAQIMRYLEVIPGELTSVEVVESIRAFGKACGKEPTILNRDIRGFLSNRMMYAMLREACYLVESGIADVETVDRSFRNDIGWWALLAGPFRWMDLTGIPAYAAVMEGLMPELSNQKTVPEMMKSMVAAQGEGISNGKGFYPYNKTQAKRWEHDWVEFTYEMRKLADKYGRT